jgi:hypothetical protein
MSKPIRKHAPRRTGKPPAGRSGPYPATPAKIRKRAPRTAASLPSSVLPAPTCTQDLMLGTGGGSC